MQQLIDYVGKLARSHIDVLAAIRELTEKVSAMSQFDPSPILAQLADLNTRVTTQGEQIAELSGRVGSIDTRTTDQTAVIAALAGKVAELQSGGGDLSGLPALS